MENVENKRLCCASQRYHLKRCQTLRLQVMKLKDRHGNNGAWKVSEDLLVRIFFYSILVFLIKIRHQGKI